MVQVAVRLPGAEGVTQLADASSQLQVPVPDVQVRLVAPVSREGVTLPPLTVTSIQSIVVATEPAMPLVVFPSARQVTVSVDPAGTSPDGAAIEVVFTVTIAEAPPGIIVARASAAYTNARILMVPPELQGASLARSRIVK
jgi:hypothetical protein